MSQVGVRIKTERHVMLFYCFYCVLLTIVTIHGRWPVWLAVVMDMSWIIGLVMQLAGFRDYQFRAYFTAVLMQSNLVMWSVCAASLTTTMPVLAALTVAIGLYGIPEMIYISAACATFLNCYHILIAHTVDLGAGNMAAQTIMEVVSVYLIAYVIYSLNKKQLLDSRKQLDVIESLKDAERSKDDFLANISHEIRTPINTICGMSEIVLREDLNDTVRSDVFSIQTAGRSLLSIVSDVLDFSELQSGKMSLAQENYNITSTVNDLINMAAARRSGKKIELVVDCDAGLPSGLYGDEQKIRRVIMNLVDNALKFTAEGGVSIVISCRRTDYGINLIICVKDTGLGINEECQEKLFTRFNQADARRNRQESGIGLGLAISQAMVDKMGGFIMVSSKPGRGSEFQVVIPQKVTDDTPIAAVRDPKRLHVAVYIDMEQFDRVEIRDEYGRIIRHMINQLNVKSHFCQNLAELKQRAEREIYTHIFISIAEYEEGREFFDQMSEVSRVIVIIDREDEARILNTRILRLYKPLFVLPIVMLLNEDRIIPNDRGNESPRGGFIAPDTNVLAVDDSRMNLRVLEGLLEPYKIKMSAAASGAEALEKIETMKYDFIFMDHMMPEMDGIETMRRIRQKQGNYFKNIPIIALTANAIGGMREVFLAEGFQDFMAKPIELSVLERVLKRNLPQEKIRCIQKSSPGHGTAQSGTEHDGTEPVTKRTEQHTDLPKDYFNEQMGIHYCGGVENYIEVLQLTSRGGQENKEAIQRCYDMQDWKNYTIYVHALKSSMLNIGAEHLSAMAKELEYAGKRNDTAYIYSRHDSMMDEYARMLRIMRESRTIYPEPEGEIELKLNIMQVGQPKEGHEEGHKHKEKELDSMQLEQYISEFEEAAFALDEEAMAKLAGDLMRHSWRGQPLKETMDIVMRKISMSDYISASEVILRLKDWG